MKGYRSKRLFDLAAVILFLPLLLPVLGMLAVFVRLKLGSPVFFRQKRPGWRETIFELIKFRTMTDARDSSGKFLPDSQRLTPFGKWLRSTSLDELPEIWNVLRGEMSLVGPRPLLVQYLSRYSNLERLRHDVPPGVTGWAQINGRNCISWSERFQLDLWYVNHRTIWLDIKILCLTVNSVLQQRDINAPGNTTMPEFGVDETKSN